MNASATKAARHAMPLVTAFIDDLRAAFGADEINALIRGATRDGLPTFYACEGGHSVGVPLPALRGTEISAAQIVILPPEKNEPDAKNNRR